MIKKILVSQPKPTSEKSPYFEIASKYGVEVVFRPFIKIEGCLLKNSANRKSLYWITPPWYSLHVMPSIIFSCCAKNYA